MHLLPCYLFFPLAVLVIAFSSFPGFVISLNYRRYLATCLTLKEGLIRKILTRWFYSLFLSLLFGVVFLIVLLEFLFNFDKTALVFVVLQTFAVAVLYKPLRGFVFEQTPPEVGYRLLSLFLPLLVGIFSLTLYVYFKFQTLTLEDVLSQPSTELFLKHLLRESSEFACPLLGELYFFLKVSDYTLWNLTLLGVEYPPLYTFLVLYLILKGGTILWTTAKVITDYLILLDMRKER